MRFNKARSTDYIVFGLVAILLFYTLIRILLLSVTHDEALVYFLSKSRSYSDIFFYKIIPQDHMINTLLMRFFSSVFSPASFFLRLPNLIGHLLFMIFSYLIFKKTLHKALLPAAFILLNFNPYMLDFFSVARGYGLSTGLMVASIYFIIEFARDQKTKNLVLSYLFGILAVLTVVTLLYYFSALVGWTMLFFLSRFFITDVKDKVFLKQQLLLLLVIGVSAFFLYYMLHEPIAGFRDKNFAQQQYDSDFYRGTIRPMVFSAAYKRFPGAGTTFGSCVIGLAFFAATFINLFKLIKTRLKSIASPEFILYTIGLSIAVISTILFHQSGTRFLDNRFTVFVMPLMVFVIIYVLNDLFTLNVAGKYLSVFLTYSFAFILVMVTVTAGNFTHSLEWRYDSRTNEMMNEIKQRHPGNSDKEINLGIHWLFEPSTNYYREVSDMQWVKRTNRAGIEQKEFDYYYIFSKDSTLPVLDSCVLIKEYPLSKSTLYKRVLYGLSPK